MRDGVARLKGAFLVPIDRIRPDPEQPRREFDAQELESLAASVRERGVRQPIRVWAVSADLFQIVSGERRYRAALAAGLSDLPCIVEPSPASGWKPERKTVLVDQVVENWQRADLHPYDLSDALKELRDEHGLSQDDIAKFTGKPKSEISRFLAMQRVEVAVQQRIRSDGSGTYSRRHVVAISMLPAPAQQPMADRIRTEKLTAARTEQEVARQLRRRRGKDARGAVVTLREYAVGSTRLKILFRRKDVQKQDILEVLDRVRGMVERESAGSTSEEHSSL